MKLLKFCLAAAALICLLLSSVDPVFAFDEQEEYYYHGVVLAVEENSTPENGLEQHVTVRLTSGPFKNEVVTILNYYQPERSVYDIRAQEGMRVILVTFDEGETLGEVFLHDLARDRGVYFLIGLFVVLLLAVGRLQGLKTLITLAATVFFVLLFLLPNLLKGYNPIILAVITATLVVVFTLIVIAGLNFKALAAIIGTICGIFVAGLLAFWVGGISHLTGFSTHEAQMLYYLTDNNIDVRGLLFAGIIIGSLGAITDIGISVASAAAEIKMANPAITCRELVISAMNVGRDVLGTMSNTLILAYVGAATPLLLLVTSYQNSWLKIINLDLIATEVVRGMAGSIGLVVAVPITALLSGYFMGKKVNNTVKTR
ncbi:MAG: YibE/F family protein [Bacillota bacterium]